jgi:beta propeller repeat protein
MRILICGLALMAVSFPCCGDTIIVDPNGSGDYTSIQDAIDYSYDGDTVVIMPGVYPEDIFFNTRAITLTSLNPDDPNIVAATIINGTVTFDFGEQEDSVLTGLTVGRKEGICIVSGTIDSLAIYGNTVVWSDRRNGDLDVYGYNLTTRENKGVRNLYFVD